MGNKVNMVSNGVFLLFSGIRIEVCNRFLVMLFSKGRFLGLACRIDKRLEKLRKDFSLLEERHFLMYKAVT